MHYGRAVLVGAAFAVTAFMLSTPRLTAVHAAKDREAFQQPPSSAPTLKVYSRETIFDVLVTDDKGQPVRGLTRSDFTVEEDGNPQPIRSFSEYDKDSSLAAPPLPANTYSNAHSIPASGPVQIFYFDLPSGCSYPPGSDPVADTKQCLIVTRAKKYIADYLRSMPAGTQVAIFAYRSDYGLRLLQGFTTDGQRAAAAVDNLVVSSVGPPPSFDPIAAANQIADYVAGIHGRKNLIWIGSPIPIMRDGGYSWGIQDMTLVHRLMDTYDRFAEDQIAIDPLNPEGVRAPDPKRGVPLALGRDTLTAEEVATGTGGTAAYNTNDFKNAVAKIVDVASHYYTLSYVPNRAESDSHFHPIVVKVDHPGMHLIYRGGYNDEQPQPPDSTLRAQMTQATMGLGALPSTQLVFNLQVALGAPNPAVKPARSTDSRRALPVSGKAPATYSLIYNLDPSQIDFALAPNGVRNTSLEFDLAAYDPYGKLLNIRSQTLTLALTPDEYQEFSLTPFQFFLPIDLPPGELTLRAGVFDTAANKVGTLEIPLTVPRNTAPQ